MKPKTDLAKTQLQLKATTEQLRKLQTRASQLLKK